MAGHSVTLQWSTGVNLSATFNVYRSPISGNYNSPPLNAQPISAPQAALTTFIDTTVTPGTWFYTVTTVVGGVESLLSNEVKVVISSALAPAAISSLAVVISS
jgi:hypothetical protein